MLTGAVFLSDLLTPLGTASWLLYLAPLVLTLRTAPTVSPRHIAAACTVLMSAGFFLSPPGVASLLAIQNRTIGVGAFWLVAWLLEQRLARESALRASDDVFERVSDAVVALDRNWQYTYVNTRAAQIFGRRPEDLVGRHIWTEFPEGVGQPFHLAYERAMAEQIPITFEEHYPPYDRWFENRIYPSPDGLTIYFTDITARKQGEAALRESQAKFEVLFQRAPFATVLARPSDRLILDVNEAFERQFGFSRAEAVGKTTIKLGIVDAELSDRLVAEFEASGTLREREVHLMRRPGENRVFLLSSDSVDIDGVRHSLTIAQDVTVRKQAEVALRESEERLRLFVEHAPAALAMFDRDMRYLAVSRRWLSDYGLAGQDVLGCSHYEVFPEITDAWKAVHRRALAGEVVHADDDRFERAGGTVQWLRWEVRPWRRTGGVVGGIVIFTEDITRQKEAEAAVRESEERLRLALDAAHMGTFDWDLAANRITWSRWHEELWGFRPGEFGGTYEAFSSRVHPDDMPHTNAEVSRCMAAREPFIHEFRVVWPDGSIHWIMGRGEFTFDASGQPMRMRGAVVEVTERKRAVQALRDLSIRMLKAEDDERRRIAKELHDSTAQDLVAAIMMLDMLDNGTGPRATKRAQQVEDAIAVLEKSAHDIRTLSYLLHPPRLEDVGLTSAIRFYAEGYAKRTSIEMSLALPEAVERLPDDVAVVLFRVVQESLGNIHRHAESRTAAIRLSANATALVLEVEDVGRGLSADLLAAARGHGTGLGVGIPAMRERLQSIGGRLDITSSARGTTVRATVPVSHP